MAEIMVLSDDEFEAPARRPIGWNYQNANKSALMGKKINGLKSKQSKTITRVPSSDDIEIVAVVDNKDSAKPKMMVSSTRSEIKSLTRNKKQASIKNFIGGGNSNNATPKSKYNKFRPSPISAKSSNYCINSKDSILTNGCTPNHITNCVNNVNNSTESKKDKMEKDNKPNCPIIQIEILEQDESNNEIPCNSKDLSEKSAEDIIEDKKPNLSSAERKMVIIPIISIGSEGLTKTDDKEITSENSRSLFEMFIERWKTIPGYGGDDNTIKEKLWKHYNNCHMTYILSRKFASGIKKATESINKENRYVLIKDIQDSLKNYKETPFVEKKKIQQSHDEKIEEEDVSPKEKSNLLRLEKLEKKMIKIHKRIQALEEAECDLEDEDNSNYLLLDRLKSFFLRLDDRYCRLANYSPATGRPIEKKFKYEGSRYPEINKRISAWVNKHKQFPDYLDILDLVKNVTKDDNLPLIRETVRVQAQEIFRDVGKILKSRRQKDDMFSIYAYAGDEFTVDPADTDVELHDKLKINDKSAKENLNKVFHHFVEKEIEQREQCDLNKEPRRKGLVSNENSPSKQDKLQNGDFSRENNDEEPKLKQLETCDLEHESADKDNEFLNKEDSSVMPSENEPKGEKDSESESRLSNVSDCDDDSNISEVCEPEMTKVDDINELTSDSSGTQSADTFIPFGVDDIQEVVPSSELKLQEEALDQVVSSEKQVIKNEYYEEDEEDIVIADSPSPDDGNESDLEVPLTDIDVNTIKRRMSSPIRSPKKRCLSSPEVVELD